MEPKWVPASRGFVPDGAALGCTSVLGPIFIARTQHSGCVIPAKLVGGLHCIGLWQGKALKKEEYQVLCYAKEAWQLMFSGIPIPPYALPIGSTDSEGVLFMGRVHLKGGFTFVGKVTSKDSKCYVYLSSEKREIPFSNYEILTVPPESLQALTSRAVQSNDLSQQNAMGNNFNFGQNNMHPNFSPNNVQANQNFGQNNMPTSQNYCQNYLPYQNLVQNNGDRQNYYRANNVPMPNFPCGSTFGNQYGGHSFNSGQNLQFPMSGDSQCLPNLTNRNLQSNYSQKPINSAQNGAIRKNNDVKSNNRKMKNNLKGKNCNDKQQSMQGHPVPKLPPKCLNLNKLLGNPDIPSAKRMPHDQDKQPDICDGNEVQEKTQPQTKNLKKKKQKDDKEEKCCHLFDVPSLSMECEDRTSGCEECCDQHPGRNFECLHCRKVLCHGSNKHMMSHALKTSHFVCISQENLAVWCFKCDTFLGAKQASLKNNQKKAADIVDVESKEKHERQLAPKDVASKTKTDSDEEKSHIKKKESAVIKKTEENLTIGVFPDWLAKMFPISNFLTKKSNEETEEIGSKKKEEMPANIQYVPIFVGTNPFIDMHQEAKKPPCWVRSKDSEVPEGALSGGKNHQGEIYVARVEYKGALIPGKFVPSYSNCFASSNGKEILKREFEVLCHVDAKWVEIKDTLPGKAVQGGYDDDHRPLFIGRKKLDNGSLVVGKVEKVDGEYQFVYLLSRKEMCCTSDFEVLVSEENVPVKGSSKPVRVQELAPKVYTPRTQYDSPRKFQRPTSPTYESSRHNPMPHTVRPRASPRYQNNTQQPDTAAYIKWVTQRDGNVASDAVVGGSNHKGNIYVARAEHNGEIIPGKLIPSFKSCYIAFNGEEVRKKEYQVLCESNTTWRATTSRNEIPSTAIPAGKSGDLILYIGRVCNGNRITIGKVDEVNKVCVAVQSGHEVDFNTYEILISTVHDSSSLKEMAQKLPTKLANLAVSLRESRPPASITQKTDTPRYRKKEDRFELKMLSITDEDYIYVSDKMQKTIKTHPATFGGGIFTKYNITKIEKVYNSKVWDNYWHCCKKIKAENNDELNEQKLFHGSPKCQDIVKTGFDERHSSQTGMFGAGVYFAQHSSKSNQYTLNSGFMLLCRVALGKIAERTTAEKFAHAPVGHHSVKGVPVPGGLNYPEYIIYRGEQAFPAYLITYTIDR